MTPSEEPRRRGRGVVPPGGSPCPRRSASSRPCCVAAARTGRSSSPRGSSSTCALSLLAAGTLYTDAVTLAGLHRELRESPAADRAVIVRTKILPDRLADADAAVVPELQGVLGPTGGSVVRVLQSSPYADAAADPATVDELARVRRVRGDRGPRAARRRGVARGRGNTRSRSAISQPAAALLGVARATSCTSVRRLDTSRPWTSGSAAPGRPTRPTSGGWPTRWRSPARRRAARSRPVGPLVVAAEDLVTGPLTEPLDAEWRAIPRGRRLHARNRSPRSRRSRRASTAGSTPRSRSRTRPRSSPGCPRSSRPSTARCW